jgi:hypothetical protein
VYIRLPEADTEAKRRATSRARRPGLNEHREAARQASDALIAQAASRMADDVPDAVFDVIDDAALVTCWGRATVPRHGYGRREIDGMPVIESPPRVVKQLHALACGLLALGLPEEYAAALVRRVALDSMPEDRRSVLAALSLGEPLTTSDLGRVARLNRHVARMRAEELEAIGVVHATRTGTDLDEDFDRRPAIWRLAGSDGCLIADVFAEYAASVGWHEKWFTHTTTPQVRDQDHEQSHIGNPLFVPPSSPPVTSGIAS